MEAERPLRFQPTLMVYAVPEGRAVRNELALLLPGMDEHRRAGIAFLECDGTRQAIDPALQGGQTATPDQTAQRPLLASRVELDASDVLENMILGRHTGTANQRQTLELRPLTTLVVEALRGRREDARQTQIAGTTSANQGNAAHPGVLDEKVIQRIKEDGYSVPNAQAVVWVVASPQFSFLADIVRDVRRALRLERVSGRVILVLPNAYDTDIERRRLQEMVSRAQPWPELLGSGMPGTYGATPNPAQGAFNVPLGALADFAFLFETRDEIGFYWSEQDSAFAAAEMIFTLMTTGIMGAPDIDRLLRNSVPHQRTLPFERMGGVGTSRLTFPRAYIELYSAGRMAERIVINWASRSTEMDPKTLNERVAKQKVDARRWVARMRGLQGDDTKNTTSIMRALFNARPAEDQQRILQEFNKDLDHRLVFKYFEPGALGELEERASSLDEVLRRQWPRAEEAIRLWRVNIKRYWREYERERIEDLNRRTANEVLMGAGGVEQLQAFYLTLDQHLADAKLLLETEREQREREHLATLARYNDLSRDGPWMDWVANRDIETNTPNQGITVGPMARQQLDPSVVAPEDDGQQGQTANDPGVAAPRQVSLEEQIIAQLAARNRWNQDHRPVPVPALTPPNIAPLALFGTPPLVMLLVALMSGLITALATPLGIALLSAAIFVALFAVMRASLPQPQPRATDTSRADLIEFHRSLIRYQMRVAEDEQREALLIGLHVDVRDSLDRLTHWREFVTDLGGRLNQQAAAIESRLFNGSIGRRDICVANANILHPTRYGLAALDEDLTRHREESPRLPWHSSASQIANYILDKPFQGISLARSSPGRIYDTLFAACREIVRDYLDGQVASISAALRAMPSTDQSSLLNELARRSRILYHPDTAPNFEPLVFVCARDQDRPFLIESDLTRNATMARIQDADWLGMIRFTHGGGAPDFWEIHGINGILPAGFPLRPSWGPAVRSEEISPPNGPSGTYGADPGSGAPPHS